MAFPVFVYYKQVHRLFKIVFGVANRHDILVAVPGFFFIFLFVVVGSRYVGENVYGNSVIPFELFQLRTEFYLKRVH